MPSATLTLKEANKGGDRIWGRVSSVLFCYKITMEIEYCAWTRKCHRQEKERTSQVNGLRHISIDSDDHGVSALVKSLVNPQGF